MAKLSKVVFLVSLYWSAVAAAAESPNGALARRDYTDTLRSIVFLQERAQFMEHTAQRMATSDARRTRARIARIHNTVARLKKQAVRLKLNLKAYDTPAERVTDTRPAPMEKTAQARPTPTQQLAGARPRRVNPFLREEKDQGTIYKGLTMESRRDPR